VLPHACHSPAPKRARAGCCCGRHQPSAVVLGQVIIRVVSPGYIDLDVLTHTIPDSAAAAHPLFPPAALMPLHACWQPGRRPSSCHPDTCAGHGRAAPAAAHTYSTHFGRQCQAHTLAGTS
jgi:hypothetical protein